MQCEGEEKTERKKKEKNKNLFHFKKGIVVSLIISSLRHWRKETHLSTAFLWNTKVMTEKLIKCIAVKHVLEKLMNENGLECASNTNWIWVVDAGFLHIFLFSTKRCVQVKD